LDFVANGFQGFGATADEEEACAETGEMESHGAAEPGAATG
jgi:hypothetical protein